jgi:glycosyltransferase involved in cell wall biosynthesis
MTALTVVIPAHDEQNIIESALRSILDARQQLEIVVVANGCSDATAERARRTDPAIRVIDIPEASKIAALNAGSRAVVAYPVAFVDADVAVSGADLVALAERLGDGPEHVASPRMRVIPSTSWWVRQYYRVWALTDYRSSGHIGSGVYMLSAEGRARFGDFPAVIADDLYVQRLFRADERLTPDDLHFSVRAPGNLRALVKRNTRIAAGNLELAEVFPELTPPSPGAGASSLVTRVWRRPGLWVGFAVYTAVYVLARRRARALRNGQHQIAWSRDETSREAVG